MIEYDSRDPNHSLLLQKLWYDMRESGDMKRIFYEDVESLHSFFTVFSPPVRTFMAVDENGIWMMNWFTPWLNSAFMGLWIREDKRHSKEAFKNLISLMNEALNLVPVIMGVTRQPELLEIHRKLGYDISVVVNNLYGDFPGWIVSLHRNNFRFFKEDENGRRTGAEFPGSTVGAGHSG